MPDSSSGVYSLPSGYLAVTGQLVESSQHNAPLEDIAAAMTRRLPRDGRAPMLGNLQMNGYKAVGAANAEDPQDYVTLAQVQALIAAVASIPTGAMMFMASTVIPTGWLALNGQSVSRTTYAALWAYAQVSGNLAATEGAKTAGQFGPGNGSSTFTLPNLYADSGYFIRPMASGRTIGSVQADEIKSHTHSGTAQAGGNHSHTYTDSINVDPGQLGGGGSFSGQTSVTRTTSSSGTHTHSLDIDATGGTETRPKNIAFPVLIKT